MPIARKRKTYKQGLTYLLAFSLAFGAFFSGVELGQGSLGVGQTAGIFNLFAATPEESIVEKPDLTEFWRVWNLLDERFANSSSTNQITTEEKIDGAISGLVKSYGDPYTVFFPPKAASAFDENISGNFSGVGMEVGLREGVITVIAPLPETPAEAAGILAGDVIVKIDDVSTEDITLDKAVSLIRGKQGTDVVMQIYREGEMEFKEIRVTRDTIDIPTVKTEQVDNVFIIALYSFNAVSEPQVRTALQEYLNSGADTLIFDVRGNPGGFLQSSVEIASYFLPAGKVVVKEQFNDSSKNDVFRSRGRQIQLFTPQNLVVLVDGGSASASEILAGALKDHGVATIIGSQTFGKGSVQELVKLDTGASLKVTIARWLTPNGVSISDGGLTPDIIINRTPADRIADIDPQKDAAIRFLRGEKVVSESFNDIIVDEEDKDNKNTSGTGE